MKHLLEHIFRKHTGEGLPSHPEYYIGYVTDSEAKSILGELLYALDLFEEDGEE